MFAALGLLNQQRNIQSIHGFTSSQQSRDLIGHINISVPAHESETTWQTLP